MTAPRTAAGRALLAKLSSPYNEGLRAGILAIEAEASAGLRAALERMMKRASGVYQAWHLDLPEHAANLHAEITGLYGAMELADAALAAQPAASPALAQAGHTPCPICPHWLEMHNADGTCGCGAHG